VGDLSRVWWAIAVAGERLRLQMSARDARVFCSLRKRLSRPDPCTRIVDAVGFGRCDHVVMFGLPMLLRGRLRPGETLNDSSSIREVVVQWICDRRRGDDGEHQTPTASALQAREPARARHVTT
jgi:hypothetical protein